MRSFPAQPFLTLRARHADLEQRSYSSIHHPGSRFHNAESDICSKFVALVREGLGPLRSASATSRAGRPKRTPTNRIPCISGRCISSTLRSIVTRLEACRCDAPSIVMKLTGPTCWWGFLFDCFLELLCSALVRELTRSEHAGVPAATPGSPLSKLQRRSSPRPPCRPRGATLSRIARLTGARSPAGWPRYESFSTWAAYAAPSPTWTPTRPGEGSRSASCGDATSQVGRPARGR